MANHKPNGGFAARQALEEFKRRFRFYGQQTESFRVLRCYSNDVGSKRKHAIQNVVRNKQVPSVKRVTGANGDSICGRPTSKDLLSFLDNPSNSDKANISRFIGRYRGKKGAGNALRLTAEEFSTLIRFLGTISSVSPASKKDAFRPGATYSTENIFGLDARALLVNEDLLENRYWAFVLELAKDKRGCGYSLTKEDHYWLMVAALEDATRDPSGRSDHVKRARTFYLLSHRSKPDWTLHFRYLESLHSLDSQAYADEIVVRLSNLMLWHDFLPWRLVHLFQKCISAHSDRISTKTRSRAVHAFQTKVCRRTPVRDSLPPSSQPPSSVAPYDVSSVRDLLADVMFAARTNCENKELFTGAMDWAISESRAAVGPFRDSTEEAISRDLAWNNIRLLTMSYGLPNLTECGSFADMALGKSRSTGWTVICALAAVEASIPNRRSDRNALPPSPNGETFLPDGFHDVVRTLWVLWRNYVLITSNGANVSPTVVCCTLVSFLRLAALLRDLPLLRSLAKHIADALVYPALYNEQSSLTESALLGVAVEYAVTNTIVYNLHTWEDIVSQVQDAQLFPAGVEATAWKSAVANGLLVQLARHNVSLAYGLYRSVDDTLPLNNDTIRTLGEFLAASGFFELSCTCLFDKRLQEPSRGRVLAELIAHISRSRQHSTMDAQTVRSLARAVAYASHLVPSNSATSWSMEKCLLLLLDHGHFAEAAEAVQSMQAKNPSLLKQPFINSFFSRLLASRRHRLIAEMVSAKKTANDQSATYLFPTTLRSRFLRRLMGRPGFSSRLLKRSVPFSMQEWPTLRRFLRFNPRLAEYGPKIVSLKLSNALSKSVDTKPSPQIDDRTLEDIIGSLVRAGRERAAMKYADAVLSSPPPSSDSSADTPSLTRPMPTKVGNMLIAASLRPRRSLHGARQLRHATSRLAFLVKERGFVPDRVTLNLVLKALLRWSSVAGAEQLRALFDRLVASGYPGASPAGHGLFDTTAGHAGDPQHGEEAGDKTDAGLPLKGLPKGISFARHTRPLYRMFASAFRARGDREAAIKVQDVLRSAASRADQERIRRDWYRREGRRRKGKGNSGFP